MQQVIKPALLGCLVSIAIAGCASNDANQNTTATATSSQQALSQSKQCLQWDGQPITVDVTNSFEEGTAVKDFYSGQVSTVYQGKVTFTPAAESGGLLLLESATKKADKFNWDSASVYFVITDRFYNGNPSNDNSYGRSKDGANEIGTFHGGDIAGLTEKLDYIEDLGINAIWITAPYEQIRGWVGGGMRGEFKHYAYHGYYAQDYTVMDQNMGSAEEFKQFVDSAHAKGIRVVMDIVMNHTGYATLADMQEFKFGSTQEYDVPIETYLGQKWTDWTPGQGETWHSFNDYIDYGNREGWVKWWGPDWVRTDISGYPNPGPSDFEMSLAYLPDFQTESDKVVGLPPFYKNKPDTKAVEIPGATVRDYLVTWLSDWVREYGIDGFRADTVKHVEPEAWQELKLASTKAFQEWKKNNPNKVLDDNEFWMTGEFWGQGLNNSRLYASGFDSLIDFTYQTELAKKGMNCLADMEDGYERYAKVLTQRDGKLLSYVSSHDTRLAYGSISKDLEQQKQLGSAFLLMPTAVQVFYGDETAREKGPRSSDKHQATRSDMNWDQLDEQRLAVYKHWQKLLQFRKRHQAVGAGEHKQLNQQPYVFERRKGDDAVVVVYAGQASK
ncbi:alpha-amylase [Agarivorans gilvus]|uniref:Alpha-amylase n=1 Tax=Agarivorans gilvus TaxID=680279 RepID=A0ABQ1I6C2_9ALTE|nr:alpha-amylase [Agarivorans gilvus]GGB16651.1 alpha-amylase [Agarivorans gilvus]